MCFTETLWEQNRPLYESILELPFNVELCNGELSKDRFAFYVKQDSMYLADFSRALAVTGTRAPDSDALSSFLEFAGEAVAVEQALHNSFLQRFDTFVDVPKSPACFAYTHFLLSTAAGESYPVACAALLPCFWIYREVGLHIHARAAAPNPYQDWIDTYAGADFSATVDRAIDLTEQAAAATGPAERDRMAQAFFESTRLEWMFWDSAYRLEQWPI
ncbi:MAG TPA: TenA family protein [Wenzhouxiangellaceae bacterium]|nr:TenA family protein [Wenzhouxiangellaceae bacterium]